MKVLEIHNLKKSFGPVRAVKGVSFYVKQGQCFGLLGPNGAGKSTTIEMIEGITEPDSGTMRFRGEPFTDSLRSHMGVQFQSTSLPPKLKVGEALATFRNLYPQGYSVEELVTLCQLEEFVGHYHEKISGGQRQRLLLAIALCHSPELVMLDEPTTGLDPQARRHVWDIVEGIKAKGKTVILTTHYMDEAEKLCDEVAIMDHGEIIAQGSPHSLLSEHCRQVVVFIPEGPVARHVLDRQTDFSGTLAVAKGVEIHTTQLNDVLQELARLGEDLSGINIRQSNLDDLFLLFTGKDLRT